MTDKQIQDYNRMRDTLVEISKYQTPDKLRKDSQKDWGLEYEEALEMAYENIQETARMSVIGVRKITKP